MGRPRNVPIILTADGRPVQVNFSKTLRSMENEIDGFNRRVRAKSAASFGFSPSDLKAVQGLTREKIRAAALVEREHVRVAGATSREQLRIAERTAREKARLTAAASREQERLARRPTPKDADAHVRAFRQHEKEAARSAREVERINAQTARQAAEQAKLRTRADKVLADVQVREAKRGADEHIRQLGRQRQEHARHVQNIKRGAAIIAAAIAVVGAVALSTVQDSFQRAASFDSLKRGLVAVTRDANEAERQLVELKEIGRQPGIGFREAVAGATRLEAVGISAGRTMRILRGFANAIALTGGSKEQLNEVTVQLTQMAGKGKVLAQDLRPIIEASPAVATALKNVFGTVSSDEIAEKVTSMDEFFEKLLGGLEDLPRATGGAQNSLDNFNDAYDRALIAFGTPMLEPLSKEMDGISAKMEANEATFERWGRRVADIIHGVTYIAESRLGSFIATVARATSPLYDLLEGLGSWAREPERARPARTEIFDAGNGVAVDPRTLRPVITQTKEQRKELEKQEDVVVDLRREIEFFGDRSEAAATKQKLLSAGVKDLNGALAQQALRYAAVLDKMRDAAEVEELIQKKREEAGEYQKGLQEKLRDTARDARERARDINRELTGFTPSERFQFDTSVTGQEAASVGASVKAELDDAREALDELDQAAAKLEPFRKRKAAMEALTSAARSMDESFYDAANPAADKFEEFLRQLERDENLPELFASRVRDARRELESWEANPLMATPPASQRAADFEGKFRQLLSSVNDGKGKIALTADEVLTLSRRFGSAAAAAFDFDRSLKEKQALESYTSAMKDLDEVINRDVDLTQAQRVEKLLLTDAFKNLTDAQRANLRESARGADVAEATKKGTEQARENLERLSGVFEGAIDATIRDKWRGLMNFIVEEFKRALTRMLAAWLASKVMGVLSPGAAGAQGGGFSLGRLFGLGGGGNGGGVSVGGFSGGTFNVGGGQGGGLPGLNVGGAISGGRSGGFMGALKGLFGFGGAAAGAADAGAAAGPMVNSAAFIAEFGAPPALAGGGAAAGAGGAGAGGLGSLGALFTNPWTAVIAGAAIGGFALWKHFSNRTEKALRKEIKNQYQLDVKDTGTLKQVKQIGEQFFGKGKVRDHLQETVRLDQVKDLLASYAESTGQTGSKLITDRQLAEQSNPANQFIAREYGGRVWPGQEFLVGERRPEVFVPDVPGRIEPSVESYRARRGGLMRKVIADAEARARAAASSTPAANAAAGASQRPGQGSQQGGMSPAVVAALMGVLGRVADAVGGLEAIDPDSVVAKAKPSTVANHAAQGFGESGRARRDAQNNLGLGNS